MPLDPPTMALDRRPVRPSRPAPLLALAALLAACGSDDDGGRGGGSSPSIARPPVVEAGARVPFRISDPDGELRAGDFLWSADSELGTFEPYLPGAEEVYLVARADLPESAGVEARLGTSLSSLFLDTTIQVDPIVFASGPAPTPLPGGDGPVVLGGELAWRDGVLVAAWSLEGQATVLARFHPEDGIRFTHLQPAPAAPDYAVVRVLELALGPDAARLYALLEEPGALMPRLARFTFNNAQQQFVEDFAFAPPQADYMAIAADPLGRLWVAAEPTDPAIWRLDESGQVVELAIWPSAASTDLRGMAVDGSMIVLADAGGFVSLQRADESDQRSASVSGGEVTDVALDDRGRVWLTVLETASPPVGSLRVVNAFGEEVATLSEWGDPDAPTPFQRPLAIAADDQGDLRVFDDVDAGDGVSDPLARIATLDRQVSFPAEALTIEPAGALVYRGESLAFRALTSSGQPASIRWSSPFPGLAGNETLDGESIGYTAATSERTVTVRARLLDDPEVETTVYVTTVPLDHQVEALFTAPGTNGDLDVRAALSAGGGIVHVAYHNPAAGAGTPFVQRRPLDGDAGGELTCEPGSSECVPAAFSEANPEFLAVATDAAGNGYWIDAPAGLQPELRRWRAVNTTGQFTKLVLPEIPGGADGAVDRFLGSLVAGPPVAAGSQASLYAVMVDAPGEDPLVVRYDLVEPLAVVSIGIVGSLGSSDPQPALALEPDGGVLVGDAAAGPVVRFAPLAEGGYADGLQAPGFFDVPDHLGVDSGNRIYAARESFGSTTVRIVARSGEDVGEVLQQYDLPPMGGASTNLRRVLGMAVTPEGRVRMIDDAVFQPGMEQAVAGVAADPRL